jgi:gamma-glutamyltranspeptidase
VAQVDLVSGTQGIARTARSLAGGADPRREGAVLENEEARQSRGRSLQ